MVVIPAGSFLMGTSAADAERDFQSLPSSETAMAQRSASREAPQHSVTIGRSFGLGKYLVTRAEFAAFVRDAKYLADKGCALLAEGYRRRSEADWQNPGFPQTDRDPVVCVNWQDAQAYVAWLNRKTSTEASGSYELPSEAEWEYAARAGTRTARWWGDAVGLNSANCDGCGDQSHKQQTTPVGIFRPNPFGLFDMLGNAWERTEDCWNETYDNAPNDGVVWTTGECRSHILRGGGYASHPWLLRSATRTKFRDEVRSNDVGFRVAKTLP
jgi:formylglycine-generating enzyme required for sulfatase activity